MSTLDDKIREALNKEDDADPALFPDEQSVWTQWFSVYQGRNRWINILATVYTFAFVGLAVWCAVAFFRAETTRGMLAWGFGFLACVLAVGNLKLWIWMQMDKNAVLREVKRLELRLAMLTPTQPKDPE